MTEPIKNYSPIVTAASENNLVVPLAVRHFADATAVDVAIKPPTERDETLERSDIWRNIVLEDDLGNQHRSIHFEERHYMPRRVAGDKSSPKQQAVLVYSRMNADANLLRLVGKDIEVRQLVEQLVPIDFGSNPQAGDLIVLNRPISLFGFNFTLRDAYLSQRQRPQSRHWHANDSETVRRQLEIEVSLQAEPDDKRFRGVTIEFADEALRGGYGFGHGSHRPHEDGEALFSSFPGLGRGVDWPQGEQTLLISGIVYRFQQPWFVEWQID